MHWEKIPFHTEHKYFDNKLMIKYTKWSNEKTLKIIDRNVSVGIKLNLSYYSILQYISPILLL